jgi:hypothetical protein
VQVGSKRLRRIGYFVTILASCFANGVVLAQDEFVKLGGVRVYSNVEYTPSEKEFSGDQVMIIPSNDGEKVLWRAANGEFGAPLLLDTVKQGQQLLKVKVPNTVVLLESGLLRLEGRCCLQLVPEA